MTIASYLLIKNAETADAKAADILAVFSTGAYNYAIASNYSRPPIPAVFLQKADKRELWCTGNLMTAW